MRDEKLKEIEEEDFIIYIFIALFVLKLYSNKVERKYRIYNDTSCRKRYHYINEITFIVAMLISIYYVYTNLKNNEVNYLAIIANVLSIVGVLIFLYFEIISDD